MRDSAKPRGAACSSFLRNSENRNRENLQWLAREIPAIAARLKSREHDSPGFSDSKGEGFDDVFSSTLRKLHGEASVFYIGHRSRCNQSQFAAAPTSAIYADIIPEHSSAAVGSRCDRSAYIFLPVYLKFRYPRDNIRSKRVSTLIVTRKNLRSMQHRRALVGKSRARFAVFTEIRKFHKSPMRVKISRAKVTAARQMCSR